MDTEKVLTAEDLEKFQKPLVKAVAIPALGGTLHVRAMTSSEGDDWEAEQDELRTSVKGGELRDFTARFLIRVLCRPDGEYLYPPAGKHESGRRTWTLTQVQKVAAMPKGVLDKLWATARKLSVVTESDLKEFLGFFGGVPSASSGTA